MRFFLSTCLAIAHALFATYLATFLGSSDCTKYVGVIQCNFSCNLFRHVRKRNPLKTCYTLQSRAATFRGFKTIHAIVAEGRFNNLENLKVFRCFLCSVWLKSNHLKNRIEWFFGHFFAPYLQRCNRNNTNKKLRNTFWCEKMLENQVRSC